MVFNCRNTRWLQPGSTWRVLPWMQLSFFARRTKWSHAFPTICWIHMDPIQWSYGDSCTPFHCRSSLALHQDGFSLGSPKLPTEENLIEIYGLLVRRYLIQTSLNSSITELSQIKRATASCPPTPGTNFNCQTKKSYQWRTDRACGQQPVVPNVACWMVQTTVPRPQKSCGCDCGSHCLWLCCWLPAAAATCWLAAGNCGWVGGRGAIENDFWNGWLIWFLLMLIPANIFLLFCGI